MILSLFFFFFECGNVETFPFSAFKVREGPRRCRRGSEAAAGEAGTPPPLSRRPPRGCAGAPSPPGGGPWRRRRRREARAGRGGCAKLSAGARVWPPRCGVRRRPAEQRPPFPGRRGSPPWPPNLKTQSPNLILFLLFFFFSLFKQTLPVPSASDKCRGKDWPPPPSHALPPPALSHPHPLWLRACQRRWMLWGGRFSSPASAML